MRLERELVALLRLLPDREKPDLRGSGARAALRRRSSPSARTGAGARGARRRSPRRPGGATAPSRSGSRRRSPAAGPPARGGGGSGRRRASRRCCRPRPRPLPGRRRPLDTPRRATSPASPAPPRRASRASRSRRAPRRARARRSRARPVRRGSASGRRPRRAMRRRRSRPARDRLPSRRPQCGPRLRSGSAERLDLAALVRLARRAHVVRALRLLAGRADVDARRLDPVLGAALVSTCLGGFLLGDCHRRLRSVAQRLRRPGPRAMMARRHLRGGNPLSRTLVLISLLALASVAAVSAAAAKKRRRGLPDRLRRLAHVRRLDALRYGRRRADGSLTLAASGLAVRDGRGRARTTAATTTTAAPTWSARRSRR